VDDRELLEAFVPYLRYDAQDGYRAVSAATMTDAPCNCLTREQGTVIAGKGSFAGLSLDALGDYPGSLEFAEGDRLLAAPNPLEDAVRMQREADRFPHCAYGRAVPVGGRIWLQYWLWYYDNPKTFLGTGRHQGDWELVVVELDRDRRPRSVTCSQHTAGESHPWKRVDKHNGTTHPLIYVAPFSHANYFKPGTRFFFPGADHPTDIGPEPVKPAVVEFGDWQEWGGQWGADVGVLMGPRLLRPLVKGRLGGQSPNAPIAQTQRWCRPDLYHRRARLSKPVAGIKLALWLAGKANHPLAPRLTKATLAGTRLTAGYELVQRGPHRSKHLLLTVHTGDEREEILLSHVVRKAPHSGEEILELPTPPHLEDRETDCVVYASAFNALGQRSDPIRYPAAGTIRQPAS
jgi:hypothetical protein